jgi:hypothetical protein
MATPRLMEPVYYVEVLDNCIILKKYAYPRENI